MRADRLINLVLLLRQHGRLSAGTLAERLEVSTRTVLRDIDALSVAGVPVYAERGRHGGFALLPGFQAELATLTQDEALALLVAGRSGAHTFGLGPALASAMRKVVDALPAEGRAVALESVRRLLVEPDRDLLSRASSTDDDVPDSVMSALRSAVFTGSKVKIRYAAMGKPARWRTVDPIGLVTVRGTGYLLAVREGEDRTYRLSRIVTAEALGEPAERASEVDLRQVWDQRAQDLQASTDPTVVRVRIPSLQRERLLKSVLRVEQEDLDSDGFLCLQVVFHDRHHAQWALWQLGSDALVSSPDWLRQDLQDRAWALLETYAVVHEGAARGTR